MSRARLALRLGAVPALTLALALVHASPMARAVDPPAPAAASETFADNDPAGAEYAGKLKELVTERASDLEHAYRDALEKTPCARAELTMAVRVKPDPAFRWW